MRAPSFLARAPHRDCRRVFARRTLDFIEYLLPAAATTDRRPADGQLSFLADERANARETTRKAATVFAPTYRRVARINP